MITPALHLSQVRFFWPGQNGFGLAVDHLSINPGETVLLTGASGSGKTTLLNLITGIVEPESGLIKLSETAMTGLKGSKRDRLRAEHCGIVFQMFNLLPYLSVLDNICLPLQFAPKRRARVHDVEKEARRLMDRLDLNSEEFARAPASRLSVGQQQRVAAARALIGRPPLIIADEPTSALDRDRQDRFLELLFEEVQMANAALLMVSHDKELAKRFHHDLPLSQITSPLDIGGQS